MDPTQSIISEVSAIPFKIIKLTTVVDNFSQIVLEHKEEVRNALVELFPKMPEIKSMSEVIELAQV